LGRYQNKTGQELMALSFAARAEYLERMVAAPQLGKNGGLRKKALQKAKGFRRMAVALGDKMRDFDEHRYKVGGNWLRPVFYLTVAESSEGFSSSTQRTLCKFDLLRLETARRIYTLEHGGKAPARQQELVPALLPALPLDRFAKDKAPYRTAAGRIYSLGPDAVDQRGAVRYDPTNGSTSAGDLVLD
jgi:hypothetical protein